MGKDCLRICHDLAMGFPSQGGFWISGDPPIATTLVSAGHLTRRLAHT
jgi:hypothetical protein